MPRSAKRETDDPVTMTAARLSTALANRSARRADSDSVARAHDLVTFERRVEAVAPELSLLIQIRAEFLETPDLRLTRKQARRLCGVEDATCQRVLDTLVDMRFLCLTSDGAYARTTKAGTPAPEVLRHLEEARCARNPSHE
jgi:hypothetical protein